MSNEHLGGVARLREEQEKVVKDCESRIQHWKKLSGDYEALNDRLKTLPDQLSYDITVPFGPLAFMPGKLVHTNEVTAMKYVKSEMDDLSKTMKNFEARVGLTKDLENISSGKGDYIDIREDSRIIEAAVTKGRKRIAHKPNSKPKLDAILDLKEEEEEEEEEEEIKVEGGDTERRIGTITEEELWARLDELEKLEQQQDDQDRLSDNGDMNGEGGRCSTSSKRTKCEAKLDPAPHSKKPPCKDSIAEEDDEEEEGHDLPTILFSHTMEPKKVRINTGKNTMLKFSERKEQHSKKKKKNGLNNGHHELHKITTPNGEPIPRKSILKSRSRENSVCSDTSESSAADFDERRMIGRSFSHDDTTHSDTSDGLTEEDSPTAVPLHPASRFEAFSGTVVEKDPMPTAVPHLTLAPPALPTIMERKQEEVASEVAPPQEAPKRVSKFKAARLQQK
ncbi:hypothetical protein KUCAC02_021094 [Chaenocephalus aceratus]|uniref:Uncharacterized protein n=1 Tax=Chaenocephalus aceratus TaxID=36190 RepID=A0ACB9XGD9_CHAAC|nr:hypothetical protein KUCAC02_021094 [Chaenocephalus aceratus]